MAEFARAVTRPLTHSLTRGVDPSTLIKGGGVAYDAATLFAGGRVGALLEVDRPETLWRDTAGTLPVTDFDTHTIARIDDRSGNGNNALQSGSGTLRPTYRQSASGRPMVGWDAVDDFLVLASALPAGPATMAMAMAYDPVSALANNMVGLGDSASASFLTMIASSGNANTVTEQDSGSVPTLTINGIAASVANRGAIYTAIAGGSVLTWTWTRGSSANFRRIGQYIGGAFITPKFRKFLMIDKALSAPEIAALAAAWEQ